MGVHWPPNYPLSPPPLTNPDNRGLEDLKWSNPLQSNDVMLWWRHRRFILPPILLVGQFLLDSITRRSSFLSTPPASAGGLLGSLVMVSSFFFLLPFILVVQIDSIISIINKHLKTFNFLIQSLVRFTFGVLSVILEFCFSTKFQS